MFRGLKILVIGAGLSGLSAARWLAASGARVTVSDTKPLDQWDQHTLKRLDQLGLKVEAGGHSLKTVEDSHLIVVSPGVPLNSEPIAFALKHEIPLCGDFSLAAALWKGPVIAITGTNGKTTTTKLAYEMVKASGIPCVCGGNIGTPLFDLFDHNEEECVAVVEVSSFQLDYCIPTQFATLPTFKAATVLNLAPDHLDRYANLDAYKRSKAHIFDMVGEKGLALLPDNEDPQEWICQNKGPVTAYFGIDENADKPGSFCDVEGQVLVVKHPNGDESSFSLKKWGPKGLHNLANLAAAAMLAKWCNASSEGIQSVIDSFEVPEHRFQLVAEINGIQFYNDSKATNVAAACSAIKGLDRPGVLIAGGSSKGEDFAELGKAIEKSKLRAVVLMGEEAQRIRKALPDSVRTVHVKTNGNGFKAMEAAAKEAVSLARQGDLVLLSPACASFDLYESYVERGNVFKQVVEGLKG